MKNKKAFIGCLHYAGYDKSGNFRTDIIASGFQMTFKNGLTISVQWGYGNYCDNRLKFSDQDIESKSGTSDSAEIAIWDSNNQGSKWFKFDCDVVKAYCSSDEVAIWIDKVRRAKSIKTIKRIKNI